MDRTYLCIDLKSFYASVECRQRGLDPFTTNLVVADPDRSEKTICLAVSPAMKALGVPGRCRVFEIPKGIDYIMAVPRMQLYIDVSATIYSIYLKYISKEDIHVYSIDEVFMDVTDYLMMYEMTAVELAKTIMADVCEQTGITATAGIGSNLYLAKIAMDIWAKHNDTHIGILTEESYRENLWEHTPLTDFWMVGRGIAKRLESLGIFTMKDVAAAPEDVLYDTFGINAELLIDHAYGRETTTMEDIKSYKPGAHSLSSGQVLAHAYSYEDCKLIIREMTDLLCLDLVDKELVTDSLTLHLGYERGMDVKPSNGSVKMTVTTSASSVITEYMIDLYDRIADRRAMIKRVSIAFNNVVDEMYSQYDLFVSAEDMERENRMQKAMLSIKKKYGSNAILKGMNLEEKGTTMERNMQIGGHRK